MLTVCVAPKMKTDYMKFFFGHCETLLSSIQGFMPSEEESQWSKRLGCILQINSLHCFSLNKIYMWNTDMTLHPGNILNNGTIEYKNF